MSRRRRGVAGRLTALALALASVGAVAADAEQLGSVKALPPGTPCLGAASRDSLHPCHNPALRLSVAPDPIQAVLTPYAPCGRLMKLGSAFPCQFGTAADQAVANVALLGDSHAGHWRAALRTLAQSERWRGVSITKTSCPFTDATLVLPAKKRAGCEAWARDALRWLDAHPAIHTVFISDHAGAPVEREKGKTVYESKVDGYLSIWKRLPASVTDVFVLRDVPLRRLRTLDCVEAAMEAKKPAGTTCAVLRSAVLRLDPEVGAATRMDDARFHVVDLSSFFCSPTLCFPVVGGVLVNKDTDHMTTSFSQTLAPFILRRMQAILRQKAQTEPTTP